MENFIEVTLKNDNTKLLLNFQYVSAVSVAKEGTYLNLIEGNGTPWRGFVVNESYSDLMGKLIRK